MVIRNFIDHDLNAIERMDGFAALQIRHHRGIRQDNIVCAVEDEALLGFGFLTMNYGIGTKGKHRVDMTTRTNGTNTAANSLLTDALIARFSEISRKEPEQDMCLRVCIETGEIQGMQFLLEKGFALSGIIPVLKYDLMQTAKEQAIPEDIRLRKLDFNDQSMKAYLEADFLASDDVESVASAWFRTGDPSYACYAAFCGNRIVGALSIWDLTEERAATENIFVIPAFRRKNIARALIALAFDELKKRDRKLATLSVRGTNLPAIKLYLSCGYSLYYNLLEMTYE